MFGMHLGIMEHSRAKQTTYAAEAIRVGDDRHQYLTTIQFRNFLKFWSFLNSSQNFSLFPKKSLHVY